METSIFGPSRQAADFLILGLSFPRTFFDPREATLWHAASIGRIIGGYFFVAA
jgi:hypothetical protein